MNYTVEQGHAGLDIPDDLYAKLIWTDPPYGTGKVQSQRGVSYKDGRNVDYVRFALWNWSRNCLAEDGVLAVCADYRLQSVLVPFLVNNGMAYCGDIVWSFALGRPRDSWWPVRHNTISTFVWPNGNPKFDKSAIPRELRKAPKKGYEGDKQAGSVWDYTMSNTDPERVGYPNQKPLAIIEPFVLAHTDPGDLVIDPFCGSSSTGVAALRHGREYHGRDLSEDAVRISRERLAAL